MIDKSRSKLIKSQKGNIIGLRMTIDDQKHAILFEKKKKNYAPLSAGGLSEHVQLELIAGRFHFFLLFFPPKVNDSHANSRIYLRN